MFRHTLLLIYRNFKRFKSTFFINLIGLSTGLACALLIFLWVRDELRVGKFHEKDSRLYQVMEYVDKASAMITRQTTAEAMANLMPEVEHAVTAVWIGSVTLSVDEHNISVHLGFTGSILPQFGGATEASRIIRGLKCLSGLVSVTFSPIIRTAKASLQVKKDKQKTSSDSTSAFSRPLPGFLNAKTCKAEILLSLTMVLGKGRLKPAPSLRMMGPGDPAEVG